MNSAFSMGDRLCQIEAMDGAAKCLEVLRAQRKICNCRPLEFNNKLLQTASRIGAKLMMRAIRIRLCNIYESLGDSEQLDQHEKEIQNLQEELEMICGACDNAFGFEADSLEALPCAHILHARCLYDMLNSRDRKTNRTCPDCDKIVSSTLYLQDNDKPSTISLEASFFR